MKFLAPAVFLLALLLVGPASADPFAHHVRPAGAATSGITLPAAWAGVWVTTDTTYTCAGVFQSTSTFTDTLCAGQTLDDSTFTCTGSADANTFTLHCSATGQVFTDCQYTITADSHGTRSTDSYVSVATTSVAYSGTAVGCDLVPPSCVQVNTHGTRIGPAPTDFCATPAALESWGRLKATYR